MWSIKCTDRVLQADLWICSYEWGALFNSLQLELFPHFYSPVLELCGKEKKHTDIVPPGPQLKGCGMGPLLVLIILEIKFQNSTHLKKGIFLAYFSHFLVTRDKLQKFLQHASHAHTYTYFDFFALPVVKFIRYGFSLVWFLVLILIRAILEQSIYSKMVSKT